MNGTLTPEQLETLKQLVELWGADRFVLIGAGALTVRLGLDWRATRDLDVTVALSVDQLPAGLDSVPGWERDTRYEHEWHTDTGVHLDVLPAGDDELARGYLEWPESGFRMSVFGFRLVFEQAELFDLADDLRVQVATIPVLTILKLAVHDDRVPGRERDIQDLAYIFDRYLPHDDERRWRPELLELELDFDETGPYVLGQEMARLANSEERTLISRVLRKLDENSYWHGRMAQLGPPLWRQRPEEARVRISAVLRGFTEIP